MLTFAPARFARPLAAAIAAVTLSACATAGIQQQEAPVTLVAPAPIENSSGLFVSPYTSDGTIAPWVAKGRAAKLGGAVGGYAGRKAGEKALGMVPVFGGMMGEKAGKKMGREVALKMVGGDSTMRATSDLSFASVDEMILYLHVKHAKADDKEWSEVKDLTGEIYPELNERWFVAIAEATAKARAARAATSAPTGGSN